MLDFLEWVIRWIQVIPWLVMGASVIAALTPTPIDDGIVKKLYKVIDWFAINVGKAKDKQQQGVSWAETPTVQLGRENGSQKKTKKDR